ncbi:hypothetical protein KFL_003240010 [Klebsormidium nitens]|uniref:Uncharacterized protein n=1 Tax=Klebsormidium nitens TaxID=105231 RepID=A0A1Y1IC27_KLENI|nr:hypothetical protein KFL_003240010 [Klebsormidium nitens]|eukprot:GAQ86979.1 hypothetical protein KFL_003240010 [Klebsormidium nitens]
MNIDVGIRFSFRVDGVEEQVMKFSDYRGEVLMLKAPLAHESSEQMSPIQEDGIFNFSGTNLISHGLLLRNHFAAALGAAHSLNFEAGDMATRCLEGPNVPTLDDRVFDSAMQAFNDLAARSQIRHVCSRVECAHLYTGEVEAAEA